ncbi:MAG: hypothetical protein ABIS86_04975 [Streptosporangiaceae bacterium]
MTRGSLAAVSSGGARELGDIASFAGSFRLTHCGRLAGFEIGLGLRRTPQPRLRLTRPKVPTMRWQTVDLTHVNDRDFTGRCILRTEGRTFHTTTHGKIVPVAMPGSGLPYFKIVLATQFYGAQLNWPRSPRYLFQKVELRFFTELHQH